MVTSHRSETWRCGFLFAADTPKIVNDVLGNLRNHLAEKLGEIPKDQFRLVWITDFPMFEYDEDEKRAGNASSFHFPQKRIWIC